MTRVCGLNDPHTSEFSKNRNGPTVDLITTRNRFLLFFIALEISFARRRPLLSLAGTKQMDQVTAQLVDATMADAFRESTVMAVAHRLSSVMQHCDRVLVMSDGRIIEDGDPRCVLLVP